MRLIVVVGGGLMVLQSTQDLDAGKLAYLAVAGIAFAFSCRAVWRLRHRPMFAAAAPWLIASAILAGLIALSLPVSLAYGTPTGQWLRDAATYALFAAVPVLALDAAASMRSGLILALAVATTVLGTLSFAAYWVAARGVAALPFNVPLLPTASLPTALFVVSLAAAVIDRPRRVGWAILGGLAFGTFLVTGSRAALIFVVVFPVVVIVAGRSWLRRSALASVGVGLVAFAFVTIVQASLLGGPDVPGIGAPPSAASSSLSAGASPTPAPAPTPTPAPTPPPASGPNSTLMSRLQRFLAAPLQDGSTRERVAQYEVAWTMFASSPVVGRGLGHPFAWTRVDGTVRSDITADTPLVLPAKLGILGLAWFVFIAVTWVRFIRRLRRTAGVTIPGLAMTAWTAIMVPLAWIGPAIEDKGFSFSLMFLLALGFIEIQRAADSTRPPEGQAAAPARP